MVAIALCMTEDCYDTRLWELNLTGLGRLDYPLLACLNRKRMKFCPTSFVVFLLTSFR